MKRSSAELGAYWSLLKLDDAFLKLFHLFLNGFVSLKLPKLTFESVDLSSHILQLSQQKIDMSDLETSQHSILDVIMLPRAYLIASSWFKRFETSLDVSNPLMIVWRADHSSHESRVPNLSADRGAWSDVLVRNNTNRDTPLLW